MILGILAWTLASAFVLGLSWLITRALRTDRPSLNALTLVFLTVFIPTAWLLVAGGMGLLRPWPLAISGAAGLLLLGLLPASRRSLMNIGPAAAASLAVFRRWWNGLPVWLRWFTGIAAAVSTTRFAFLIWALPPFTWDSLTYHLTNVAAWVQSGRIHTFETPVLRTWSPANYEVFAAWFTVFLRHDVIVEAAGLPAYLLACLAVYAIGRTLGLGSAASLIASLGYASTPALLLATTATKNDPIMAALFLMLMAIGLDLAVRPGGEASRNRLGQVVVLISVWLLALGTKPYILHLTPGLLVAWLLAWLARGRRVSWKGLASEIGEAWRLRWPGFRAAAVGMLAGGLLLGLFWYVRNWVATGNPFYPYGVIVENVQVLAAGEKPSRFEFDVFAENLVSFFERFGDRQGKITPDLPYTTGWGWVAYGLGLPALVWGLARRSAVRVLLAGFAFALLLLFFSSPTSPWNMRYAIWFPAVLCLAIGFVYDGALQAVASARVAFAGFFVIASGMNFLMMLNYNAFPPSVFREMLAVHVLDRGSARLSAKVPEQYALALDIVPREDVLGYNVHGNGFIYPLYRADYSQPLAYVPIPEGSTCESIAEAIEARGTRYLFVAPEHTEDWILGLLNDCATQADVLRERARGLYVVKRK